MRMPEMLDNVSRTVKDDLATTVKKGDKLSVAAACFSIYAYQTLKKQFDDIAELRFIFTSPTFLKEETLAEPRNGLAGLAEVIEKYQSLIQIS